MQPLARLSQEISIEPLQTDARGESRLGFISKENRMLKKCAATCAPPGPIYRSWPNLTTKGTAKIPYSNHECAQSHVRQGNFATS
jgi:hypothetical protein